MQYYLSFLGAALVALVSSIVITSYLIKRMKNTHMMGRDMNKPDKRMLPEMGGLAVILAFAIGVNVVLITLDNHNALVYAAIFSCLGAALVGMIDDVITVRQRTKAMIPFLLAIPLGLSVTDTV